MVKHYDSESPLQHFESLLSAYSRQARAYAAHPGSPSVGRALKLGSLAAVVPLAAAVGDAKAQVECYSAVGTVTITSTAIGGTAAHYLTSFAAGPAPSLILYISGGAPSSQIMLKTDGTGLFPQNPSPLVSRFDQSNSFSGATTGLANAVILCNSQNNGPFCGGSGVGFLPFQFQNAGNGIGFLELEVVSKSVGVAQIRIGGTQYSGPTETPDPLHAGDCTFLLPVELVHFNAVFDDGSANLVWETASELNNAGFEIQRAAGNESFRKVGFVEGAGTTSDPQSYRFIDGSVVPNTRYRYRLMQMDFDGATTLSKVVEVFTEQPGEIGLSEIYPNPATNGVAQLVANVSDRADAVVEIFDVRGALIDSHTRTLQTGENRISISTDDYRPGSHFAKVRIGSQVVYRQFVVVR